MIFFNERKLAQDFHVGAVTEKQELYYLLIVSLFLASWTTTAASQFFYDPKSTMLDHLADVVDLLAIAITVFYTSVINSKRDNRNFISRYVCLSVPIGIKVGVLALLMGSIAAGIEILKYGDVQDDNGMGLTEFIFCLIVELFAIWRYKIAFELASGQVKKM